MDIVGMLRDLLGTASPAQVWCLLSLGLFVLEFLIPGLVVFFFGVGAMMVAGICCFEEISLNAQLMFFVGASLGSLFVLRSRLKSVFVGRKSNVALDPDKDFVGGHGVVTEEIEEGFPGRVWFRGASWSAESDCSIDVKTPVVVIDRENLTLIVKPKG